MRGLVLGPEDITPPAGAIRAVVVASSIAVIDTGPLRALLPCRSGAWPRGRCGLAITKWAVEAMGGTIELETASATGSTFRIAIAG